MPPEVALFVAIVHVSIYAFLCSLACGAALVQLFPRLGSTSPQTAALTPQWEFSNIFLAFGLTTVIVFFGNAVDKHEQTVLPALIALTITVLIKALMVIAMYYIKPARGLKISNAVFVIATFSTPLILAHLGIYMISGAAFWETAGGWAVMIATVIAITAIGLVPTLKIYGSNQYRMLAAFVYLFALAPIVLTWGNLPYFVYKNMTIAEAFSSPLYGDLMLIILALALPLTALSFPQISKFVGLTPSQA